jgi:hypothetical protein
VSIKEARGNSRDQYLSDIDFLQDKSTLEPALLGGGHDRATSTKYVKMIADITIGLGDKTKKRWV